MTTVDWSMTSQRASGQTPARLDSPQRRTIRTVQVGNGWFGEQPGGLERYFAGLIARLADVDVACRGVVVGSALAERESGGVVRAAAPVDAGQLARHRLMREACAAAISEIDADLVVSHFALYGAAALRARGGRPFVSHFHGPWAAEASRQGAGGLATRLRAAVEGLVYRRSKRCIVLSQAFGELLSRTYGVNADLVRVVPGGIDTGAYDVAQSRPACRDRLGFPQDRPIVLCVRRLVPRMGLDDLLTAMATVKRNVPDVLLLIAGKGPLLEPLRARVMSEGLGEHVRLLGFVADGDLPLAYRAADLCVVPTAALEGFGLVVAEALAAGTPSLVTPVGGLPEVVRGLSESLILPSTGPEPLAAALSDALVGNSRLPTPALCMEHCRAHFDWSVVATRVRQVYEEAMA